MENDNSRIENLEVEIDKLVSRLKDIICKKKSNKNVQIERMEEGIKILKWSIKKYKLRFGGQPNIVKMKYSIAI